MASLSPESRRSIKRRDSSTASAKRRPRLLRAAATEPAINTSNVSRGALASPQSSRRATDLLNQVAYISGSTPESLFRGSSPPSAPAPIYERIQREQMLSTSPTNTNESMDETRDYPRWGQSFDTNDIYDGRLAQTTDSGRYFSFPSFDTWEVGEQDKEDGVTKVE